MCYNGAFGEHNLESLNKNVIKLNDPKTTRTPTVSRGPTVPGLFEQY